MDLRQFKYFVTVADTRNLTRASEILHIAQPPLSRQIQQLEDELGVTLFVRSRPLRLTDAGRVFYDQAQQILGRVEQAKAATRQIGHGERTVLCVGFVASTLYGGLPTLIRRLRQHRPDLDLQLLEMMSIEQIEALKSGRIDVGFGRVRANDPGVERVVLREERLVVAIPMEHTLALESGPILFESLVGQRLIVYPKEPRPSFADHVLSMLMDAGVRPQVREVREIQTALGLVAANDGICIVPASTRYMRPDVHFRMIENEHATSPIIMSYRINDQSSYIELMKSLLRTLYAEHPPWLESSYSRDIGHF